MEYGHAPNGVWPRLRGTARLCNRCHAQCPARFCGPAPERASVAAAASFSAGTAAGCRVTPALLAVPEKGRSDRCRWRGTCQLLGLRRGGRRRDVGQSLCEGAPWGVGGLRCVCSVCSSRRNGVRVCEHCGQCTPCTAQRFQPPPGASVSSPHGTRWTLSEARCPSHGCRIGLAVPEDSGTGGRGRDCDLPQGRSPCTAHPAVASGRWMRNALLLLLLVLGARAAPQGGGHRPEDPAAMRLDPDFDPFSLELPTLLLLQSTVQSLAMPEQDVEALTREQVLLYLFVLHDHDRNGHLDGLELLQLLGTVLAQRNGGQPHLDTVAVLVDQTLERQDMSRDGLLNPPELLFDPPKQLLSPGQGQGAPGPPLLPRPREPEVLEGNTGVNGPGLRPAEKQKEGQEALQAETPQAVTQQAESPDAGLMEAEDTPKIETPEAEAPEAEAALIWGDPREG